MLLLVVDVQLDFTGFIDENGITAGSLSVTNALNIIPTINKYIKKIPHVAFSKDMHPEKHISFIKQGGPWPPHCVINTRGSELHPDLDIDAQKDLIINKGTELNKDAYSAFDGTGFNSILSEIGIKELFICGLATDYCVKATVLDALKIKDVKVYILTDAIEAVNINKNDGETALEEMFYAGAIPIVLAELQ